MVSIIKIVISLLTPLAPAAALLVARKQLILDRGQLVLNRRNQRETTARTNFRGYLKLCVEYPEFAYGRSTQNNTAGENNTAKYEWFIAHFLWAAEEILEYAPTDRVANLRLHIKYHRNYLQNDQQFRTADSPTYTPKLQNFIEETLATLPPATPQQPDKRAGSSSTAMSTWERSGSARATRSILINGDGAGVSIRTPSRGNARTEWRRASRPRAHEVKSRIALPATSKPLLVKAVAWDWSVPVVPPACSRLAIA